MEATKIQIATIFIIISICDAFTRSFINSKLDMNGGKILMSFDKNDNLQIVIFFLLRPAHFKHPGFISQFFGVR